MKHLIIGAGKIGRRYEGILRKCGEKSDLVDIEFDPSRYKRKHDSVLICTPPRTHTDIIRKLPSIPIFCEKPLFVDLNDRLECSTWLNPTLVSANWIFCPHLETRFSALFMSYPSQCPYWEWDLIHFFTWFEYVHNKKTGNYFEINRIDKQTISLKTSLPNKIFCITNERKKSTELLIKNIKNKKIPVPIHKKFCIMHIEQLRHWIRVLEGRVSSVNPFNRAIRQHAQFGNLLQACIFRGQCKSKVEGIKDGLE